MSDADLEAYRSEKKYIIKTKGEIVGICFGILFGSMLLFVLFGGGGILEMSKIFAPVIEFWFYIFVSSGTLVGIAYLPYRTRENIINDFKGIYYKSTAHYFAFHGGVLVFLFFSVGAGG